MQLQANSRVQIKRLILLGVKWEKRLEDGRAFGELLFVCLENGEAHIQIFFEQIYRPINEFNQQITQHDKQNCNKQIKVMDELMGKSQNQAEKLMSEQWKSQQDYKKMIIALELQNEKYRNELYQLGETVNKILDKTKLPQTNKANPPNLDQQLQLVKKQLHNVNQFIEIYQRELNSLSGKKKQDQIESIAASEELLRSKQNQLSQLKKEVRQLQHKNKAMEYRLAQFSRKNRAKSFDQQALQLKELMSQNKNLKGRLQELQQMQQKREVWLKNNIQSVKSLQQKVHAQEQRLPKIQSRQTQRSQSSLPKLQSQKKIYTKWLQSNRQKGNAKLEKELADLERINKLVQERVSNTQTQIAQLQEQVNKVRQRVQATEAQVLAEPSEQKQVKRRDAGCQVSRRVRKIRRDWVGKFDSLRFSDARTVREESRVWKVLFNSCGYFIFHYYSVKENKKRFIGKLPFDPSGLPSSGKESSFTVQAPDFIKNIRLKINLKSQKVTEMHLVSNLGIQGQFVVEINQGNPNIIPKKSEIKPSSTAKEEQLEVHYEMDVKTNEAISCMFGSYGFRQDDKKNVTAVWLQGLGVELIEDTVEELI